MNTQGRLGSDGAGQSRKLLPFRDKTMEKEKINIDYFCKQVNWLDFYYNHCILQQINDKRSQGVMGG